MVNKKLLKYLEQCKNLEMSIYTQEKEISRLNQYIATLGKSRKIEKPYKYEPKIRQEEFWIFAIFAALGIFLFILLIFCGMLSALFNEMPFIMILILIATIFSIVHLLNMYSKNEEDKQHAEQEYLNRMNKYKKEQDEDMARVKNEIKQASLLKTRVNTIRKQITETRAALEKLYALNIIKVKYQALVPVVMFCDYIENERCYELEGHEGAYNMYAEDVFRGIVIAKFNEVLSKLEQIKDTQEMLYNEIQIGNRRAAQLCSVAVANSKKLESIQNNSAIAAENSRITAQNTQAIADIELYKLLSKK